MAHGWDSQPPSCRGLRRAARHQAAYTPVEHWGARPPARPPHVWKAAWSMALRMALSGALASSLSLPAAPRTLASSSYLGRDGEEGGGSGVAHAWGMVGRAREAARAGPASRRKGMHAGSGAPRRSQLPRRRRQVALGAGGVELTPQIAAAGGAEARPIANIWAGAGPAALPSAAALVKPSGHGWPASGAAGQGRCPDLTAAAPQCCTALSSGRRPLRGPPASRAGASTGCVQPRCSAGAGGSRPGGAAEAPVRAALASLLQAGRSSCCVWQGGGGARARREGARRRGPQGSPHLLGRHRGLPGAWWVVPVW